MFPRNSRITETHGHQAARLATVIRGVILHQFANLESTKNTCFKFFHAETRKGFEITIFIKSFYKLFHQTQLYVKRRQDNAILINQWLIYVISIAYCKIFLCRPILLYPVLISSATVPVTEKTRMFGVPPCCPNKQLTILKSTHMVSCAHCCAVSAKPSSHSDSVL